MVDADPPSACPIRVQPRLQINTVPANCSQTPEPPYPRV